jgi:hypothetical protein
MAVVFDVHLLPASGAQAMYLLKEFLKARGWTVLSSADGLSYSSNSDIITGFSVAGSVVGSLGNTRAWIRLQSPTGGRQIVFQNISTAALSWRVKYSKAAGFIGGSPAATVTPSAADEIFWYGSGIDSSPSGTSIFAAAGSLNRVSLWADDAAPWGFGLVGWTSGGVINAGFAFECGETGSYPTADTDPNLFIQGNTSQQFGLVANYAVNGNNGMALASFGASNGNLSALTYNASVTTVFPRGVSVPQSISNEDFDPTILWGRPAAAGTLIGPKLIGKYVRWCGVNRPSLATLSTGGSTMNRLVVNDFTIPWAGIAPVL